MLKKSVKILSFICLGCIGKRIWKMHAFKVVDPENIFLSFPAISAQIVLILRVHLFWQLKVFEKYFTSLGVFGLSQKIQSNGKWFPLTVNHAPKPCKIFYTCILPSIDFHSRKIEEREKQQELRLHIQAPTRAPIAHPSTGESHPSTGEIVTPQHRLDRHHPRPIHPKPISFSTQSSSASLFSPSFSTADLSLFPSTTRFNEFFLLGFVSFVFIYWKMILYICLEVEKMWATSKKCLFYSIFKNTTKH